MTTYSVDPTFYDAYIERRLRRHGCENNMLLADVAMLTRATQSTPDAFRSAGRRYAIVPVSTAGAFHPKVHLRLGSDRGRLIVGSANATAAGWCRNLEVLADIDWRSSNEGHALGSLIKKIYDYLMHWLEKVPGEAVQYKCRLHLKDSPWLRDLEANEREITLPDGSAMDLLCERGGDSPSILRTLAERIEGEKVRRLIIVSPYWDSNLRGLRELRNRLSDCETLVAINPKKNSFPIAALRPKDDVQFVELKAGINASRFPHAKIILVETATADHVVFGSANCSDDALGLWSGVARNAEVSVYRRFKLGTVLPLLHMDVRSILKRDAIRGSVAQAPDNEQTDGGFAPGYIELANRELSWYPPSGVDPVGAAIRIGGQEVLVSPSGGLWRAELPSPPKGTLIAVVVLKTGAISAPAIVHEEIALRNAAPGQIDRRLREAFDRIREGKEDLLDLAQHAHMIFAPDPQSDVRNRVRRAGRGGRHAESKATEYETPEAFRKAVSLEPATGATGRFSVDDPGLLQVLSIVMRGIGGIGVVVDQESHEDEEDRTLAEDDTEDDSASGAEEQGGEDEANTLRPSDGTSPYFTDEQIKRRQRRLVGAMDAFDELLSRLRDQPALVSNRLAAQTAFMIQLMMLACSFMHKRTEGDGVRLMVLFPTHDSERVASFALRVTRMLRDIWVGGPGNPIAHYIFIEERHRTLPDDMVAWIVLSRWAVARAFLAGKRTGGFLATKIGDVARKIFIATASLGPIDPQAEEKMLRELDARIGVPTKDADDLILYTQNLRYAGATQQVGNANLGPR